MIIIVEDDLRLLETYQEQLANERCGEIQFFSDPQAALRFYETYTGEIDLVVLDLRMPALTGEQLIVHMLQLRPEQRIAVLTGDEDELRQGTDEDSLRLNRFFDVRIYAKPLSVRQVLLDYYLIEEGSDSHIVVSDFRNYRRAA